MADIAFPPQCLLCHVAVERQGALCGGCFTSVRWLSEPECACCGLPFEQAVATGTQCADCLASPPYYRAARAVCAYDEKSRQLITRLKFGDAQYLARPLAMQMARRIAPLAVGVDYLLPVPMHRRRLWWRMHNQSAGLARLMGEQLSLTCHTDMLTRSRVTQRQTGLSRRQRQQNVRGVFTVPEKARERLRGKHVLLVDDVMTTGATVDACCRALRKAGVTDISVITFARRL